jgi:GNAT superfamily N-acetyltransferase
METQVRTPQAVFMQPQRLSVPLFQRPYVWNEENQWAPLWNDVARLADRWLAKPARRLQPHFLGAVVLQQLPRSTGALQERTIIDGQQRLTTLQLLLDALHAELQAVGATQAAARIEQLVVNPDSYCTHPQDRFKVWPTNRDRPPFHAVMAAKPPIDYAKVGHTGERMVAAHRFFGERAREWLGAGGADQVQARATAIDLVVRDQLQLVVIDLAIDENAQEIFETLNARGSPLTPADLIKNFVFQALADDGAAVDEMYRKHWQEFETGFWETEVSLGRLRHHRSSVFLTHWLIAKTGKMTAAREVFADFKRFAEDAAPTPMTTILGEIHAASAAYRDFVERASTNAGPADRLALFGYRTGVLESEVVKPMVLWLLDPTQSSVPGAQVHKALDVVESWMVRRMLLRATTKNYNQVFEELLVALRAGDRATAGDAVQRFFADQSSSSRYWPDDGEVRAELAVLPAYRRIGRGRLRMVLEAIEDELRGWRDGKDGLGGERVPRDKYAIEHVLPRKWQKHWPLPPGGSEVDRDQWVHTLGNLTLLTGKLNSKVSNGPWVGEDGKRHALQQHDVLLLNRKLVTAHPIDWSEATIRARSQEMIDAILAIWPVPAGHRSSFPGEPRVVHRRVELADLVAAGFLTPGATLWPRPRKHSHRSATVLVDGQIDVDGVLFQSPSEAAKALSGGPMNGWWFFLVDRETKKSLKTVRREYLEQLQEADDEIDGDDEDDDG